jgi:hypothetical protein
MVADAPKHDRSCTGSFLLTPSKYLRTTSSAVVSEAFGSVVPDVEDSADSKVDAFNFMAEDVERDGAEAEKADAQKVVVADAVMIASATQNNASLKNILEDIITAKIV